MYAYDYPLLGAFWTVMIIFIWVAWIMLVFRTFGDIFQSDLGGLSKGLWSLLVILLPFLGVFTYLLVHGDAMNQRAIDRAQRSQEAVRAYIADAAGTTTSVEQLATLADLHGRGLVDDAEFAAAKAKLLA